MKNLFLILLIVLTILLPQSYYANKINLENHIGYLTNEEFHQPNFTAFKVNKSNHAIIFTKYNKINLIKYLDGTFHLTQYSDFQYAPDISSRKLRSYVNNNQFYYYYKSLNNSIIQISLDENLDHTQKIVATNIQSTVYDLVHFNIEDQILLYFEDNKLYSNIDTSTSLLFNIDDIGLSPSQLHTEYLDVIAYDGLIYILLTFSGRFGGNDTMMTAKYNPVNDSLTAYNIYQFTSRNYFPDLHKVPEDGILIHSNYDMEFTNTSKPNYSDNNLFLYKFDNIQNKQIIKVPYPYLDENALLHYDDTNLRVVTRGKSSRTNQQIEGVYIYEQEVDGNWNVVSEEEKITSDLNVIDSLGIKQVQNLDGSSEYIYFANHFPQEIQSKYETEDTGNTLYGLIYLSQDISINSPYLSGVIIRNSFLSNFASLWFYSVIFITLIVLLGINYRDKLNKLLRF